MKKNITYFLAFFAVVAAITACEKNPQPEADPVRKCCVYIGAGYNSLTRYLREDIEELEANNKIDYEGGNVLLVFEHLCEKNYDYTTRVTPTLSQVYRGKKGGIEKRTLFTFPSVNPQDPNGTVGLNADVLRKVLEYTVDNFKCDSYGMVFSSHGFAWLPEGYYADPGRYDPDWNKNASWMSPKPHTVGEEKLDGGMSSYEMPVDVLASCFPRQFDYILIDACLMGCVEVAWDLKDATKLLGFSQTEILADGLPYASLLDYLFTKGQPDVEGVCREYIRGYQEKESSSSGATFSLVETSELDLLALVCRNIFSKYRYEMSRISGYDVQGFFRYNRHFVYDLEDIIKNIERHIISAERLGEFKKDLDLFEYALGKCVKYKGNTRGFMGIPIRTDCGLSSYLPSDGTAFLNNYYKTLSWNEATGFVID